MPRKTAGTLEQQRNRIKRDYKRGPRKENILRGEAGLSAVDREVAQRMSVYLKAQNFSFNYIADAVGVHRNTVRKWFDNEELNLAAHVAEVQRDMADGAVKLLKTYAIELIEELMNLFRTTEDEALAAKLGLELLDRLGVTKVNKSESKTAATIREEHEVSITDKTGLLSELRNAPPEVQARAADLMDEFMAMAAEHTEQDVTHD